MQSRNVIGVVSLVGITALAGIAGGFGAAPSATAVATAAASDFKIDGSHSSLVYKISHLGTSNFYGRFNTIDGEFTFDPAAPESGKIEVTIKADSIDSANAQRDGHLKSPDFFNTKQFPTITFKSTSVKKSGAGLEVTGDLTLLGKTQPVTAQLLHIGEKDGGPKFGYRSGLEATFTIKRSDFGMNYGVEGGVLGNEVTIIAALEGVRK